MAESKKQKGPDTRSGDRDTEEMEREVLKRMLRTPPKPHKDVPGNKAKGSKK